MNSSTPDFHDGFVDGVLLKHSEARILLRTVDEQRFTLVLSGVDALNVDNLKKGNIIFDVEFWQPRQLDESFIFEIYSYTAQLKEKFVLRDWAEKAEQNCLTALSISPSYGCSVMAIFKRFELVEGHLTQ